MHLLKISIEKETYAYRNLLLASLTRYGVCQSESEALALLPAVRAKTDACRAAAAYTLLRYQRFYDQAGRLCKAIAKSPKNAKKKGMDIQIHVQACGDDTVEYSQLVARLYAPQASAVPELIREQAASDYAQLCADLNIATLVEQGQSRLYDNDLRKIMDRLLEPYTVGLWTGLSLVLDDTGMAYLARVQKLCNAELSAGTITLSTLALDMSHANRKALAQELAQEFDGQLQKIAERCSYTAPNVDAIMKAYELLSAKISQAETLLGLDIPISAAQLHVETAIMALA